MVDGGQSARHAPGGPPRGRLRGEYVGTVRDAVGGQLRPIAVPGALGTALQKWRASTRLA